MWPGSKVRADGKSIPSLCSCAILWFFVVKGGDLKAWVIRRGSMAQDGWGRDFCARHKFFGHHWLRTLCICSTAGVFQLESRPRLLCSNQVGKLQSPFTISLSHTETQGSWSTGPAWHQCRFGKQERLAAACRAWNQVLIAAALLALWTSFTSLRTVQYWGGVDLWAPWYPRQRQFPLNSGSWPQSRR